MAQANDSSAPKYFSPFLTPPISDEDDRLENNDLLKLAVQTKFSVRDVSHLTKMDISIPMRSQDL